MTDHNLVAHIKSSLAKGNTKEDIYRDLLAHGSTVEAIEKAFNSETESEKKEDMSKKTVHIIVTVGAILIGAGFFSFIASNWSGMPKAVKIGIILFAMIGAYASGWNMKKRATMPRTGEALILLGSIIYGAGIFLVAQMFNIRANWPDGFILWMLGTIAVGFTIELYSLFYLAMLLGVVSLIGHPVSIFGSFGYNPFLLTSSLLLLVATVITFLAGRAIQKKAPHASKKYY